MKWIVKSYNDGTAEVVFTDEYESHTGFMFTADEWIKFRSEVSNPTEPELQEMAVQWPEGENEISLKFGS